MYTTDVIMNEKNYRPYADRGSWTKDSLLNVALQREVSDSKISFSFFIENLPFSLFLLTVLRLVFKYNSVLVNSTTKIIVTFEYSFGLSLLKMLSVIRSLAVT